MVNTGISLGNIVKGMFLSGLSSRMEIRDHFNLSKASVTLIVNRMFELGLITEGEKTNATQRGRKTTSLNIRPDTAYFLGTDLEGLALRVCLIDCNKNIISRGKRALVQSWSQNMITKQWLGLIAEVLENSGIDRKKIAGVGIGLPGLVDCKKHRSRTYLPPGKWVDFNAEKKLSQLGLPIVTANNVFCITEYERAVGVAKDKKDFISILTRYGIGMSICSNGSVLSMNNINSGEIGHMQIDIKGQKCICGQRGCLDTFASGRTWNLSEFSSELSLKKELTKRAEYLGIGLSNLLKLFYSPAVILNGIYNDYSDIFIEPFRESIANHIDNIGIKSPEVIFGEPVEFKTSIGAAIIAAGNHLESYLDNQK